MFVTGPAVPRNHGWNTRVVMQGLVGILTYMTVEGFRSGDVEVYRVRRGDRERIHLGYIWLGLRSDWDRI